MNTLITSATDAVEQAYARIEADGRPGIWIELVDRGRALAAAAAIDARLRSGEALPLAGTTLAVKGNIDVAGHRTTAGCPSYGTVADRSAPVVEALEAAGAVVVGITNLDQFATGLVGTRSPYGICPNAHWPGRVSGGSSSGSAVAVAAGLVDLALGTDTAGSGRVPAAANGIVGLKGTRGWISMAGVVPACRSLDCVAVFARTVPAAALAARIAGVADDGGTDLWRREPDRPTERGERLRIGVPSPSGLTFDGDPDGSARFSAALQRAVSSIGDRFPEAEFLELDVTPFVETGALLYEGAFVAERFDAVGPFVSSDAAGIDPVVRKIIARSEALAAWEMFRDLDRLQGYRQQTARLWESMDAFVVPSIPRLPTVAEVRAEPIAVNAMLGTYTNFVNLLDLAALTFPVGVAGSDQAGRELAGPPQSLTLVGPAWTDERLIDVATAVATSG